MLLRLLAIAFIFVCTSIAWAVLGATVFQRTYTQTGDLREKVQSSWGAPQTQSAPIASYPVSVPQVTETEVDGKKLQTTRMRAVPQPVTPQSSRIAVALGLDYRQKGLLWYSTYGVDYRGTYTFQNPTAQPQAMTFTLHLPATRAIYDNLVFRLDGQPVTPVTNNSEVYLTREVAPQQVVSLEVGYRSQGLETWHYSFGNEVSQVRDFQMRMTTNFDEIDFPENALSPTVKQKTASGWQLEWSYQNLVSGYEIAMVLPQRLQPGPLAGQISYFAPVSLFFFFFLMFMITTMRKIDLHPMNYFFLAAAFFAFHLLLAYLVDHLSIHVAFAICSVVSIGLVVSYLRLVIGEKFAFREAALAQFLYLVLFSYAFFFRGFTGLAVTIGAILTLFVVMQLTGRIRWEEQLRSALPPPLPNDAV